MSHVHTKQLICIVSMDNKLINKLFSGENKLKKHISGCRDYIKYIMKDTQPSMNQIS